MIVNRSEKNEGRRAFGDGQRGLKRQSRELKAEAMMRSEWTRRVVSDEDAWRLPFEVRTARDHVDADARLRVATLHASASSIKSTQQHAQ